MLKKSEILFNRLVSPWRISAASSALSNLLLVLEAYISFVIFDELHSEFVKFLEVIRRGCHLCRCITKPSNILLNMINELVILLAWICVVKSQIATTTIFFSNCEVEANSLSMSNMKVTIGFWRKSCSDLSTSFFLVGFKMLFFVCTCTNIYSNKL